MMRRDKNLKKPHSSIRIMSPWLPNWSNSTCSRSVSMLPGREYEIIFKERTDSADAHFWEARVLAAEGKWDGVEAHLRRTLNLDRNFSGAYDLLVQSYIATNKLPQAIKELQDLLAKNPKNSSALMTLALVYDRMKDYPKERDAYEQALAIDPNFCSSP